MSEHDHQAAFVNWARQQKAAMPELGNLFAIPNGAKLPWFRNDKGRRVCKQAGILKAEGLEPGVPDMFLAIPNKYAHGLFLEFKSAAGKLSVAQDVWRSKVQAWGYYHMVVRDWSHARLYVTDYLSEDNEP